MVDLSFYAENRPTKRDVSRRELTEAQGRGEYVVPIIKNFTPNGRLYFHDYLAEGGTVKKVSVSIGHKDLELELDEGIGRMRVNSSRWLVVQDNSVCLDKVLPQ